MGNYKKGTAGFLIENGSILLTQRKTEPFAGYWEVPAGKQEPGESLEKTIVREFKEETNLDVEVIEEIGINTNNEHKFESHMFLVRLVGGTLMNVEPHAHSRVEFVSLKEIPEKLGSSTVKGLAILKEMNVVD